ncbi:MAG: hypothetical protein M1827_007594 [Pycnora praestabilis]|nr:MAG: hypothetical protein M1827_007594 [Pycnora praestabilis]
MSTIEAGNLFNVNGLVAVITGGGSGIGLMMAKALEANGAAKVYIIGRRKEVLEAAAKEAKYGNIIPLQGDVTSKDSLHSLAERIKDEVGYINVLIANSGIVGPQVENFGGKQPSLVELRDSVWKTSMEEFTNTYALNTTAVFYSILAFLELLDDGNKKKNVQQKSQVIATSSIGGFNRAIPAGFAYGTSKAACTLLMKQLATYLVPYGIRSNVLAPGRLPPYGDVDIFVYETGSDMDVWTNFEISSSSSSEGEGKGKGEGEGGKGGTEPDLFRWGGMSSTAQSRERVYCVKVGGSGGGKGRCGVGESCVGSDISGGLGWTMFGTEMVGSVGVCAGL